MSRVQYWKHDKTGEVYAVIPADLLCFGPLHRDEIGTIWDYDDRFDTEDWEWLKDEPTHIFDNQDLEEL